MNHRTNVVLKFGIAVWMASAAAMGIGIGLVRGSYPQVEVCVVLWALAAAYAYDAGKYLMDVLREPWAIETVTRCTVRHRYLGAATCARCGAPNPRWKPVLRVDAGVTVDDLNPLAAQSG